MAELTSHPNSRWQLHLEYGESPAVFELAPGQTIIGRSEANFIALNHPDGFWILTHRRGLETAATVVQDLGSTI
ncbi:MAG: hypothetical protein U1G07_02925 [Verrucomicrobiota bacterium]